MLMLAKMSTPNQSFETEIKLKVENVPDAIRRLEGAGFRVAKPRVFEANTIYDTENLELRGRSSVLRLRQAGGEAIVTFKGPSQQNVRHKVREELETHVADAEVFEAILGRIGYHRVFRYEKYRTEYYASDQAGVATLDETPIGVYVELEGSAQWIDEKAKCLGYSEDHYITMSYGRLYLDYCKASGKVPADMIF